jgi:hypothetical protein
MDGYAVWAYEALKRCGRNQDRYEAIRPKDYQAKEEPLVVFDLDDQ